MKHIWLAVPVLLVLALGLALYLNQPKVVPDGGEYVNVNGDEYLDEDYTSPSELLTGETGRMDTNDYYRPASLAECDGFALTKREWCVEQYALWTGDTKGCDAAQEQSTKDDCYTQLAILNNDVKLCGNVSIGQAECSVTVAVATKDAGACENGALPKKKCYEAFNAKDISLCPQDDDRKLCNDAVLDSNALACESVRDYSEFCYYNIGVDTNNASLCNKAGNSWSNCFFRIALATNNAAVCENLTDSRDNCVAWVAFNTGNESLCYQAGKEAQSCLEDIRAEE